MKVVATLVTIHMQELVNRALRVSPDLTLKTLGPCTFTLTGDSPLVLVALEHLSRAFPLKLIAGWIDAPEETSP